mgnify:CR=1 FL=1
MAYRLDREASIENKSGTAGSREYCACRHDHRKGLLGDSQAAPGGLPRHLQNPTGPTRERRPKPATGDKRAVQRAHCARRRGPSFHDRGKTGSSLRQYHGTRVIRSQERDRLPRVLLSLSQHRLHRTWPSGIHERIAGLPLMEIQRDILPLNKVPFPGGGQDALRHTSLQVLLRNRSCRRVRRMDRCRCGTHLIHTSMRYVSITAASGSILGLRPAVRP